MKTKLITITGFILCFLLNSGVSAESSLSFNQLNDRYYRFLQLKGEKKPAIKNYNSFSNSSMEYDFSGTYWEGFESNKEISDIFGFSIGSYSPEVWVSYNSDTSTKTNDGAIFQGKGFNTRTAAGFFAENSFMSLYFYPEFWWSQNSDFDIIPTDYSSGYGDYWTVFDNLQRYGEDAYQSFSWGQTGVHFNWEDYLTLGFSNENITVGPCYFNNIILGYNGDGFPHFDAGTPSPVSFGGFGNFELRFIWGYLRESEFFDDDDSNDWSWITGSYLSYSTPYIPNLTLGFNYQYYKPLSEWESGDLIRNIPGLDMGDTGMDNKDMMISLTFDWLFPKVGFELYGEWGRNDNFSNYEDIIRSPEHTQAISVGFNQFLFSKDSLDFFLTGEVTNMERKRTYYERAAGPWYRHYWAGWVQGYTNNGQLLGAVIGPGSNSQALQLSCYYPSGETAFSFQRISYDEDYYYLLVNKGVTGIRKYVELLFSLSSVYKLDRYKLFVDLTQALTWNYLYIGDNDYFNTHLEIGLQFDY